MKINSLRQLWTDPSVSSKQKYYVHGYTLVSWPQCEAALVNSAGMLIIDIDSPDGEAVSDLQLLG